MTQIKFKTVNAGKNFESSFCAYLSFDDGLRRRVGELGVDVEAVEKLIVKVFALH
jgi:hypothetical protein